MADHIRKQIRDVAKTALTGLATSAANVFSGRVRPLTVSEMPGLAVFLNTDDPVEGAYNGGPTSEHSGVLRVECQAQGNDDLIDTLDTMAKEVEVALFANAPFLAKLMVPPGPPTTQISVSDPVEGLGSRTGNAVLLFPILFRSRLGDPTTQV